jgi:hypothetical protein
MMLGSSITAPELEYSKALNIQYPNAINGDAIRMIDPTYGAQTWLKYGGQWNIDPVDDRFPVKRIIADLTGAISSTATGVDSGKLALIGLLGVLLLRGVFK